LFLISSINPHFPCPRDFYQHPASGKAKKSILINKHGKKPGREWGDNWTITQTASSTKSPLLCVFEKNFPRIFLVNLAFPHRFREGLEDRCLDAGKRKRRK
jgi:hypothetical protein